MSDASVGPAEVTSAEFVAGTVVRLGFGDGAHLTADLSPLMVGPVFEALSDESEFRRLSVDPELGTITWPNGADLDPEVLRRLPDIHDPDDSPAWWDIRGILRALITVEYTTDGSRDSNRPIDEAADRLYSVGVKVTQLKVVDSQPTKSSKRASVGTSRKDYGLAGKSRIQNHRNSPSASITINARGSRSGDAERKILGRSR